MSDKLKPCPLCCGVSFIRRIGNDMTKSRRAVVKCGSCGLELRVGAIRNSLDWCETVATERWNTRTISTSECDQWKALFLETMGKINNADDRNPMCPCGSIIFEAIQRMPK